MTLPKVGFTPDSASSFLLDSGVIVTDFKYDSSTGTFTGTPLGATQGGVKMDITTKTRDIKVDGAYITNVMGLTVNDSINASITANLVELSAAALRMALNGTKRDATEDEAPEGYEVIESKRYIEDSDYIPTIAVYGIERGTGKEVIFAMDNALVTSPTNLDMQDSKESVVALTLEANATAEQMLAGEFPWRIFYPTTVEVNGNTGSRSAADSSSSDSAAGSGTADSSSAGSSAASSAV